MTIMQTSNFIHTQITLYRNNNLVQVNDNLLVNTSSGMKYM